ncbi:MAG: LacI family DNA-binding transcriptional regulator [Bacillota bacterium]|mgnify:CR=1 FL=1|jgi:DNA-binding LacI/PurR family transcriptional regulator|nr:LacI family transcriptional regulator [Bacillota bacterium]HQD17577.1 LacI family DNA-binding transcriptional regulator [Bacillota bacterium]
MPTIRDVAKRAGVSVATVSAVINADSGVNVSEEKRRSVEKAIEELNYRPNRIAQALSKRQTKTIAYVVPTISNEFFSQMAHFIEDRAFEREYGVYLCNTHSNLERVDLYMDILIENQVAGVVTTLTWDIIEQGFIDGIRAEGIPIVGLAGARVVDGLDTVTIDDVMVGRVAVTHLIDRGHRKIGFIGIKDSRTTGERLAGYLEALRESGIEVSDDYIGLGTGFSREDGYQLAGALYSRCPEMTAVFVYNDVMAAGAIDRFRDMGVRIPDEMAVVGCDNSISDYTRPKLTTLDFSKEKMVEDAMDLLFRRIAKEKSPYNQIKVVPQLIVKESS